DFYFKLTAQWREENKDKLETPEQLLARIKQEREARYEQQLQEWKAAVKEWEESGKSGKRPARSRMPKPVSTMAEEEISHLESLPSGWLWLTAESVGIVQLGRQRSPKNRSKDYPTKYIRAANITEQGLDLDDVLDMDFLPHELSAYRLEKGDLVLSEASGSAAQVGKPAIWDDQIPNCCFQNTVIRHQPYCRDYAVYLLWLYRFLYVSGKFAQVAGGVGINHLSAFKFAQIALPLCSLAEQQEIVRLLEERFAAIEQQEREIDSALNQAEMLRQSILKKAFTGQLVPQDPRDEPASVLLERIKAEREKAAQNNHSKKTRKKKTTA
ncbi:MAG: restriction endonuclease subunit S, partial [Gemmatimonadetes bacterium]|nr:restriction endonuclease subunit S [Gemmatimonadota bacterium]